MIYHKPVIILGGRLKGSLPCKNKSKTMGVVECVSAHMQSQHLEGEGRRSMAGLATERVRGKLQESLSQSSERIMNILKGLIKQSTNRETRTCAFFWRHNGDHGPLLSPQHTPRATILCLLTHIELTLSSDLRLFSYMLLLSWIFSETISEALSDTDLY